MADDDHRPEQHGSLARLFGWPTATGVAAGAVLLVLQAAVDERDFWIAAGVVAVVGIVAWLGYASRAITSSRRRIDALERQAAQHAVRLDRHQIELERLAHASLPQWLRVAIAHVERHGGRIDVAPEGLRFVTADAQADWTIPKPLPADATVQHLHHRELHGRLGIDQRAYTAALLDADAPGRT